MSKSSGEVIHIFNNLRKEQSYTIYEEGIQIRALNLV